MQRRTEDMLKTTMAHAQRAAKDPEILEELARADGPDLPALTGHLQALADSCPFMEFLGVADDKSMILATSKKGDAGRDASQRGSPERAIIGQKAELSGIYLNETSQRPFIDVAAPIVVNGKSIGVVFGAVSLDAFFKSAIEPLATGKSIRTLLLSPDNVVVPGDAASSALASHFGGASLYEETAAAARRSGVLEGRVDNGAGIVAAYEKTGLDDMTVAVYAETADVFAPLKALRHKTIVVAAVAMALGALLPVLIIGPAFRAFGTCARFARRIADGNLDDGLSVRRGDDLGRLADALRDISAELKALAAEYRKLTVELVYGEIEIQGDASKFSGAYAALVQSVNAILSRYQLILNVLTSPVIVLDKDTRITFMNDVAKKIGGDEYRGKACREIMRREDDSTPDDALMRAVKTLHSAKGETIAHPLGKSLDISYTAVPFTDPETGALSSALQLITDLTEIKSTQRVIQEVANHATGIANRWLRPPKSFRAR